MSIKLYTITTDPTRSAGSGVISSPIELIPQSDGTSVLSRQVEIPSTMSQIVFSHFMDLEKCVEYLSLGRKLGSAPVLALASGAGMSYTERTTEAQKRVYLNAAKNAFVCFLNAAKCANVSLMAWNKLRRVLEVMTCVPPWQPKSFYNHNGASGYPVKAPLWARSVDGIWRNSIANLAIGSNTWTSNAGMYAAGLSPNGAISGVTALRLRNPGFPEDKLGPTTDGVGPHIRFGMPTSFRISQNYPDEGLRHVSDSNHISSIRLRTQLRNFTSGDCHPFWFNEKNDFISIGYGEQLDPYPAEDLIAANAPVGHAENVNQNEGHIPGVYGIPGVTRDYFAAYVDNRVIYEACGTPPLEWYTRLFYARIPGLAPGVKYQDMYTDVMERLQGMSLADYILTIGIESWVAEVKLDAELNTRAFVRDTGSRLGDAEGLAQAIIDAREAAPSADPGSANALRAAGTGTTGLGGAIAATGVLALPGAIIAAAGVVASLASLLIPRDLGNQLQVIAERPRDVYGYFLSRRRGGSGDDYVVNPTAFLAFEPGGSLNLYVNQMFSSLDSEIAQPSAIMASLPENIQRSIALLPNGSNRIRPIPLEDGYSPLLEKSTIPEGQTIVSIQRPLGAENVIVSLEGNVLETGDLIKSGKYDVSFAANGAIFSVVALKFKSGQSIVIRTPIPSGGPITYRDESEESSIVPWLATAAAIGAGAYWYKNGGKETIEEWRKRMG